jgi:hypothetical protein
MTALIAQLRDAYDTVLIDTPPLLPVTDAAAVSPASDGVILVCRYKSTKRDQLRTAAQAIRSVSSPVLGTVFTMVSATGPRAYARYIASYRAQLPSPLLVPPSEAEPTGPSRRVAGAAPGTPLAVPRPGAGTSAPADCAPTPRRYRISPHSTIPR